MYSSLSHLDASEVHLCQYIDVELLLFYQVSEGLDFADHAGRAVVVTGLPFATSTDAKV